MSDLTEVQATLPTLIDRAAQALSSARSSAEVLEARDQARTAYDAAKSAGRMARAKKAHEEVIGAVYRAQADALLIEARAKIRLADEYDAAQERGEVAKLGDNLPSVDMHNSKATAAELGIRRDEIHEARKLRDAETKEPGKTERALNEMVERGEQPTKGKLRRELVGDRPKAEKQARDEDLADAIAEIEELRAERDQLKDEVERLKLQVAELSTTNSGLIISKLQKQYASAKYERDNARTDAKRMEYKMKRALKRVEELENMEVTL